MNNGICKYNTFCNNVILYPDNDEGVGCDYRTGGTEAVLRAMDGNDDPSVLTSVGDWGRWKNVLQYYYDHPDLMAKAAEMWPGYFAITGSGTVFSGFPFTYMSRPPLRYT